MRFKSTSILLIIFLGLGLFVYFTEFRGREEREAAEAAKDKVVQVPQNDIVEISLLYPDRTITGIKKGEKQWDFTNPAGIEANPEEWDRLASNFVGIERQQIVAENATDLTAFGLDNPPIKVAAKLADGKTVEVAFGAENPSRTYNYAKLSDSNEVFLTLSSWKGLFTKAVDDLRNRKVLPIEADTDIDAIRITEGNRELELQKTGENWAVKKPLETPGDNSEILSMISSVRFAQVSSFAEPAVTARAAGLEPPVMRIVLHDTKAQADRTLLIGRSPETDKYYARDASKDTIVIIDRDIPEKARRPLFDWRDKAMTTVQPMDVEEVEIRNGSETFSFKKDGNDWKLPDGRTLQWDKVTNLMTTLEFDKVTGIIDSPRALSSYGLERPRLEAVFRKGTTELLRLSFGGDSSQPQGVYLKASDRPSIQVVSADTFNKFNVKVNDLIEQTTTTSP
jgi:hypothetical protein